MQIFSWLPQRRGAPVTFDLFGDLDSLDSDLPGVPSASSRLDTYERRISADQRVKGSRRSVALLGVVFVALSAAVWATAIVVQAPSVTATLPPARETFHGSTAPRNARNIAATAARTDHREGFLRRAENLRFESARNTSDAAAALPDINASKGSRYTSLEPAACTIIQEEAKPGLALRRCPGIGGFALETGDARPTGHFAIVGPDGKRSELNLSGMAPSGSLGKLAEWRAQGKGEPRALIVRVSLPGKRAVSSLIVAKLDSSPCIVAVIPRGPRQNEKARRVADGKRLECPTGT